MLYTRPKIIIKVHRFHLSFLKGTSAENHIGPQIKLIVSILLFVGLKAVTFEEYSPKLHRLLPAQF